MIYTVPQEYWKFRRPYWSWLVVGGGGNKNSYKILVDEPLGKQPLGRMRRTWNDNFKMNLIKMACEDGSWTILNKDHVQW
jgi:hypothetical protein